MSMNHVKVYYGPCESSYLILEHKPQKLKGLKDRLQKLGYKVDLAPVDFINYCVLEVCGHEIFRCNIQNLKFNTAYQRDPVCQRAITAVLESEDKFKRARSCLWFRTLLEDQLLIRNKKYGPKDHWPKNIQIPQYDNCLECMVCCGMNVVKEHGYDVNISNKN